MDANRRFIFNGSASAYGGHFVRPEDVVLASNGASALSEAGGRCVWTDTNIRIGKAFRLSSAYTSAEGLFDNREDAIAVSYGKKPADSLTATTSVRAEVRDLAVGGAPPLKPSDAREPLFMAKRVTGALTSRSQPPGRETLVSLDEAACDGVSIDGHVLIVELNAGVLREQDTYAKLVRSLSNQAFVTAQGAHFGRTRALARKAKASPRAGSGGTIRGTIVRELRWAGKPYPGATFEGTNGVKIPNLGRIHFGEVAVKMHARRLTMIRFTLGSPTGGDAVCVDVDTNGGWSI